jgi:hypothetical protein
VNGQEARPSTKIFRRRFVDLGPILVSSSTYGAFCRSGTWVVSNSHYAEPLSLLLLSPWYGSVLSEDQVLQGQITAAKTGRTTRAEGKFWTQVLPMYRS